MHALRLLILFSLGALFVQSCRSVTPDTSDRAIVARVHLLFDT